MEQFGRIHIKRLKWSVSGFLSCFKTRAMQTPEKKAMLQKRKEKQRQKGAMLGGITQLLISLEGQSEEKDEIHINGCLNLTVLAFIWKHRMHDG